MKRRFVLALPLLSFLPLNIFSQTSQVQPAASSPGRHAVLASDYGKLPLSFEANRGQTEANVRYLSRGHGYSLFLTDASAVLELGSGEPHPDRTQAAISRRARTASPAAGSADVVRMELSKAAHSLSVTGADPLPGKANYFIGSDPAGWHANIPTYAKVKYSSVYPGIDLAFYGNQQQLEYDFTVAPGADSNAIRLHFAGVSKLSLAPNGDLQISTGRSEIAFHKPVIYQMREGRRETVDGAFQLSAKNDVGFRLGTYDHTRQLVIDPTLIYSTRLGAAGGGSYAYGVAVDGSGSTYLTGTTYAASFPVTSGAYQSKRNAMSAVFVTKLNSAGSALVYSTYLSEITPQRTIKPTELLSIRVEMFTSPETTTTTSIQVFRSPAALFKQPAYKEPLVPF